jgi:hypothetical protein
MITPSVTHIFRSPRTVRCKSGSRSATTLIVVTERSSWQRIAVATGRCQSRYVVSISRSTRQRNVSVESRPSRIWLASGMADQMAGERRAPKGTGRKYSRRWLNRHLNNNRIVLEARVNALGPLLLFKGLIFDRFLEYARVAQLVEHSTDTRKVLGSIPSTRTTSVYTHSLFAPIVRGSTIETCRSFGARVCRLRGLSHLFLSRRELRNAHLARIGTGTPHGATSLRARHLIDETGGSQLRDTS